MVHFGEFLITWSLRSNSVTRQVSFNRTNIGGKCQNYNGTFWVIFKQRDSMLLSQQTLVYWYYTNEIFIELQKRPLGHPSFDVLINRNDRRRCLGFWDRKMWEEAFFKCLREKQGTPTKMSQFLRHLCFVSYRKLMIVQYQKLPLKISTFRIFFKARGRATRASTSFYFLVLHFVKLRILA